MNKVSQVGVLILMLLASMGAGYFFYQTMQRGAQTGNAANKPAPRLVSEEVTAQFVMSDLSGNDQRLNQWAGKPQIINYWATWCSPCRKEIPLLIELQDKHADQNLVVIGLSMDFPDDIELVKKFVAQQNIDYPVLMAVDFGDAIAAAYGISASVLPLSIFVRADGSVSHTHIGLLTDAQASEFLVDTL